MLLFATIVGSFLALIGVAVSKSRVIKTQEDYIRNSCPAVVASIVRLMAASLLTPPSPEGNPARRFRPDRHAGTSRVGWRLARNRILGRQRHDDPRADGNMSKSTTPLRILLADDHVTVRHGLKLLIDSQDDMQVVSEVSDGAAAITGALELHPDVIVMDISMPGMNGLDATKKLKQQQPGAAIITLTRHSDDAYLQELLRAGVLGYVLKQSAPAELLQAIRAAAAGEPYLDSTLAKRVTSGFMAKEGRASTAGAVLSDREAEVLRRIAAGYSNKEIAARLDLSVKTVEAHKANAMRKLGLGGRIDIVKYAVLQGWLDKV